MSGKFARAGTILAAGLLLLAAPGVAQAQDVAQARAFVANLYGAYHGDGPDYLGRPASKVFSPRMLALIRRDRALTPKGDVGALDGDPICNCQDFDISGVRVSVTLTAPGGAQATANFMNFGKPETVRFDLVSIRGSWRIDNIHTADLPDLAMFLRKHAGGR